MPGRFLFRLPDVGEGVAEAEIIAWHVAVGDAVEEDQPLVDVMTDKATVDITSPRRGVVAAVHGEPGAMRAVGAVLCELLVEDGDAEADAAQAPAAPDPGRAEAPAPPAPPPTLGAPARAPSPSPRPVQAPAPAAPAAAPPPEPLAAPATRARARALGVDLRDVPGGGPEGRVRPVDLEAYAARRQGPLGVAGDGADVLDVATSDARLRHARRVQDAERRIPHITYVEECDLTDLEAIRGALNAAPDPGRPRLTQLPFFIRALVRVLPDFPSVNARFDDAAGILRRHGAVHVGVATPTPDGAAWPVVRHAQTLDLWGCAREIARLRERVRAGEALPEELAGSTISLASLGPLGGLVTTPIINAPEVAVIAPNRLVQRPVCSASGRMQIRWMMNISSSFDHRIVDGHEAASFIQALVGELQNPARLLAG